MLYKDNNSKEMFPVCFDVNAGNSNNNGITARREMRANDGEHYYYQVP